MSSILDLNSSSDSEDDCDYVPPKGAESDVSDDEISGVDSETELEERPKPKKLKLDNQYDSSKPEEKKKTEDVWKNFLNSVDSPVPCKKENKKEATMSPTHTITSEIPTLEKRIEDDTKNDTAMPVNKAPAESKLTGVTCKPEAEKKSEILKEPQSKPAVPVPSRSGGLSSLLGTIANKGKKMTVLEKSLNDWKTFKQEEGIEKDLETFNKGRQGFLERQRFLERSDLRSYETEKTIRLGKKK